MIELKTFHSDGTKKFKVSLMVLLKNSLNNGTKKGCRVMILKSLKMF